MTVVALVVAEIGRNMFSELHPNTSALCDHNTKACISLKT